MPSAARERELNDQLWERVAPLLPPRPPHPRGGRPFAGDRSCVEGVVYVLRTGIRWRHMPGCYPSGVTCWRRHRDWTAAGVWDRVWHLVVREVAAASRLDPSELVIDGTFVEVNFGRVAVATIPAGIGVPAGVPVLADRAYDSDPLRGMLAGEGYRLVAAHRANRTRPPTADGRSLRRLTRRWVALVNAFRRVATRYEVKAHLYDGFVGLACAFIALNKL